jgi:uncharacterized protein (DUF2461 family)
VVEWVCRCSNRVRRYVRWDAVRITERLEARDIPLRADPKRSIFRIYRDTRFNDKVHTV